MLMSRYRPGLSAALVVVAFVLTACGGRARPSAAPLRPSPDSIARLEAEYRTQTDAARRRFTEADVQACLAYAAEVLQLEKVYALPR